MSSPLTPVKVATAAGGLVLLTAAVWVLRGYVWPTLSNVELATLQAILDPQLFRGDFAVQEALHFTPRFYYNELILLPVRAGLPLAGAFAMWHLAALATLLAGVRALARDLGLGSVAAGVLLAWLMFVGIGTLGLTFLYHHAPVPGVWAAALVALGASLVIRRRAVAAYACFGGAALLQILVGLYAGVLALPVLLCVTARQRAWALLLWFLALALVYLPMRLGGGTDGGVLSNAAFVQIYAQLREPHHLVPTSWGWPVWVQATAFYAGACWFLRRTSAGRPPLERTVLQATLGLMVLALAINFIFVELYPLALVAKLQPARITPLAQGVVLALLATRLQARASRGDWLGAALLALIPLSLLPGGLLILAAVLAPSTDPKARFPWQTWVLAFAVLLAFQPFDATFTARLVRYGLYGAIFLVSVAAAWLAPRPWRLAGATLLTVVLAGVCARASLRPDWPRYLLDRFAVNARPSDPPGILGQRFGEHSPVDAVVLLPPSGGTWTFKLYARRAAVVDDKNSPFTDQGLREWRDRYEAVLGVPLTRTTDPVAAWRARPPEALREVALRYHADYVLTRNDWHPQLPGRRIDQEQGWSLWQLR